MNIQSEQNCKKTAILRSAMELIREHGFHGTPMSLISKQAGVACGTIYHYFPSKDDVIREIYTMVCEEVAEVVFKGREDGIDFKDQFFRECRSLFMFYTNNVSALYFLDQYKNSPYDREQLHAKPRFVHNFYAFFQRGVEEGVVKPLEYYLLAPVVFGAISTSAKIHVSGRHVFSEEGIDNVLSIIWDGIRLQAI